MKVLVDLGDLGQWEERKGFYGPIWQARMKVIRPATIHGSHARLTLQILATARKRKTKLKPKDITRRYGLNRGVSAS